jgi:hypothetical protein
VSQAEDAGLPYTVVGYFSDNGQVWVRHATGFDNQDAVAAAVRDVREKAGHGIGADFEGIAVVEVFEGHNKAVGVHDHIVFACEWPGVKEKEEGN